MQPDLDTAKKLAELEAKIDAMYVSVEKTRKYLFWTFIITLVVVVLPAIAMVFVLPQFISNYTNTFQELGL
jgi:type IV secretory pathway component VirB8